MLQVCFTGEQKQEQWVANVNAVISTYSGSARVRSLLQNCVTCPNLPRKQQKFTNFVASSFHEYNKGVVEEAWSIIEKASKLTITTPNEKDKQKPPTGCCSHHYAWHEYIKCGMSSYQACSINNYGLRIIIIK